MHGHLNVKMFNNNVAFLSKFCAPHPVQQITQWFLLRRVSASIGAIFRQLVSLL